MAEDTDDRTVIELGVESRALGRRVGAVELTRQENRGGLRLGQAQLPGQGNQEGDPEVVPHFRVARGGGRD